MSERWSTKKHALKDKYWCEEEQGWKARNQMEWFLQIVCCATALSFYLRLHVFAYHCRELTQQKQGDNMSTSEPVKKKFYTLYATNEDTSVCQETNIYKSTTSPPPTRMDRSVNKLCTIKWDTDIDLQSLPTYTNPLGKVFYELVFEIQMTCVAGSLDFAVYHNGKRQGSKHVEVDYETKA